MNPITPRTASYRPGLPPLPSHMARLPLDHRGYPVPYFVEWVDGKPDFRLVDAVKLKACVTQGRCFICGELLGRHKAFVVGPMAFLQRVSAEPPSHRACAEYALQACPFILNPMARHRPADPEREIDERLLSHNPGIYVLVVVPTYVWGVDGLLRWTDPAPTVEWWVTGRRATPDEIDRHHVQAAERLLAHHTAARSREP